MSLSLYSREDIKEIDRRVVMHIAQDDLIAEVGRCLSQWFFKNVDKSLSILILCGPGNNGNDGKALAKCLKRKEYVVKVWEVLNEALVDWNEYDVIVDAVFGISINKNLPNPLSDLFLQISDSNKLLIAIDLPSGVDPDQGQLWGGAFAADVTLVIGGLKRGLLLKPGVLQAGEIQIIEVPAINSEMDHWETPGTTIAFNDDWMDVITPGMDDHKYSRGKVTHVMAKEFPGASLLAALASQAIGAGYVDVFCPAELLSACQIANPSLVFKPYSSLEDLAKSIGQLEKTRCLCIGPGWRHSSNELIEALNKLNSSLVLDGGLLNKDFVQKLKNQQHVVLTPHEGELDDLSSGNCKWGQIIELGKTFHGTVVAKGYDTIVFESQDSYSISSDNSPFLSIAGTGDVLAGMIAGLIAQGLSPVEASQMAVYTHSYIGSKNGWGLTPEILISKIGKALNKFAKKI